MREFFKGWKRKTGVVTLVMACTLLAGWIRSFSVLDTIIVQDAGFSADSFRGGIYCSWDYVYEVPGPPIEWLSNNISALRPVNMPPDDWSCCPYWTIVAPLTLLSAWLLFDKPRATKRPNSLTQIAHSSAK